MTPVHRALADTEKEERRVLVETLSGGTVELIAEPDRVVVRIEHGDRMQQINLRPSGATNLGRRLQGVANKALDLRDARSNEEARS